MLSNLLLEIPVQLDEDLSSSESGLPEVPNFITLLHKAFSDAPWAQFLHQWENILFSFLVAFIVTSLFIFGARKKSLIPSPLQNFLEMAVEGLRRLVVEVLGPAGDKYLPFLGTIFIYILSMNLMGLVPFMKAPSSSLNITAAMAICVFCLVQYLNIKNMGFFGFLYHMAGSPKGILGWAIAPLMFPIELLTQISRPVTLSLRLFGNVLGEDILIGAFVIFGVDLVANYLQYVGVPLQLPFMFLAVLTGTMQALVFTLLSTIYILLSLPHAEESHE